MVDRGGVWCIRRPKDNPVPVPASVKKINKKATKCFYLMMK